MKVWVVLFAGADQVLPVAVSTNPQLLRSTARELLADSAPPAGDDELAVARHAALRRIAGAEVSS